MFTCSELMYVEEKDTPFFYVPASRIINTNRSEVLLGKASYERWDKVQVVYSHSVFYEQSTR